MENESNGLFFIKAEYDGELCLLIDIQGVGPWKFTANKLVEGKEESVGIEIDIDKIRFPSISAISDRDNLHKLIFFHLTNALFTSRFDGGKSRLHTGFGVKNGGIDGLLNSPEDLGEKPLLDTLFERVRKREVDWSTYFYFCSLDTNDKQGIGIDIMHPDQCHLFFIPITSYSMEDGGTYFSLDLTLTELVAQGKGVELEVNDTGNKINAEKTTADEIKTMSNIPDGMITIEHFSKLKGTSPEKIISMVRDGFYIGRKVGDDWFIDASEANSNPKIKSKNKVSVSLSKDGSVNEVIVTDIQMSFISMVVFMVKWVLASIPAFIILAIIGSIITTIFLGALRGSAG